MANPRRCSRPVLAVTARRPLSRCALVLAGLIVAWGALAAPAAAAVTPRPAAGAMRRGGESQIDESSPDESVPAAERPAGPKALPDRVREYLEGSLARYDALKSAAPDFRRLGWFPSLFLRDPERDVLIEPGPGGKRLVTAHISCARRDPEQRLVIAPADRFELPNADKRFFSEVLAALATLAPEVEHARLVFWFAVLRADGRLAWEMRGEIGLSAAAAGRVPAGKRTAEAIWPLLDHNTLPPSLWDVP